MNKIVVLLTALVSIGLIGFFFPIAFITGAMGLIAGLILGCSLWKKTVPKKSEEKA